MKRVIAIVGMPGAGKSETGAFFKEKGIQVIRFGEITDEGVAVQGLLLTPDNERAFREKLRADLGMGAYAIKMEPKIESGLQTADIVVLDGLRSWEEYEFLKKKFDHLLILAIYAAPHIRYQRLYDRKVRKIMPSESRNRDIAELINLHMGPPIALADYLIKNETSKEHLIAELEQFLEKVTHDTL